MQKSMFKDEKSIMNSHRSLLISSKHSEMQDMTVKKILDEINTKLKHCKKSRNSMVINST